MAPSLPSAMKRRAVASRARRYARAPGRMGPVARGAAAGSGGFTRAAGVLRLHRRRPHLRDRAGPVVRRHLPERPDLWRERGLVPRPVPWTREPLNDESTRSPESRRTQSVVEPRNATGTILRYPLTRPPEVHHGGPGQASGIPDAPRSTPRCTAR